MLFGEKKHLLIYFKVEIYPEFNFKLKKKTLEQERSGTASLFYDFMFVQLFKTVFARHVLAQN